MNPTSRERFEGFSNPNYTMVPDELFDELLTQLTGAELKVVLYVCRRTFGFKKREDAISIHQLLAGIRIKNGRVLDHGVGLSKSALMPTLRTLAEKGIITKRGQVGADGGSRPYFYSLRFKREEGGVPKTGTPGVPEIGGGVLPNFRKKSFPEENSTWNRRGRPTLKNSDASAQVRAKSGQISGVVSLAGVAQTHSGQVVFAFLFNDVSGR
ncbi:MAG TPA: replication protein, partial [Bdellovibrionota bacterium]|nr:replication protein [Bdellovibrionota bacterium]